MPALTNAERQRLFRERRWAEAAALAAPAAAVVTAPASGDVQRASNGAADAAPDVIASGAVTDAFPDWSAAAASAVSAMPVTDRDGAPVAAPPVTVDPLEVGYMPTGGAAQIDASPGNDQPTAARTVPAGDDPTAGGADITVALHLAELARLDQWRACQPGQPDRAAALRLLVLAALRLPATA